MARSVPTTQGMPSSRAAMAAWLMTLPTSVTRAAAPIISVIQLGSVTWQTRTSPGSMGAVSWDGSTTTRAGPATMPGETGTPRSSPVPVASSAASMVGIPTKADGIRSVW